MTRLWPEGQAITVTIQGAAGEPEAFVWHGQRHQVAEVTRRWQVDLEWWRAISVATTPASAMSVAATPTSPGRIWRSYFKLRTDTDLVVMLYQDRMSGAWYLQRLYD